MSTAADVIELAKEDTRFDLAKWVMTVKRRYGRGYLSQLLDVQRLKRGPGRLSALEYYIYGLYDRERFDARARREFIGEQARPALYRRCNDPRWAEVEEDKLLCASVLAERELPVPRGYALYHPSRKVPDLPCLDGPAALSAFLRRGMPYPFFAKPLKGTSSVGVASVERYDRASDSLELTHAGPLSLADFLDRIGHFFRDGYLFQERLEPHPDLAHPCGGRLSTVRVMVLLDDGRAEVLRVAWKVPGGRNIADNVWRPDNLLAAVDGDSGLVRRVVQGWGPDEVELETHPDTGARLKGLMLPDWNQVTAACLAGATAFPGLRLQAWDVALTPRGPVILEVNGAGGFYIPQRAWGRGLLEPRFREFLASFSPRPV